MMTKDEMKNSGYTGSFRECFHFLQEFGEGNGDLDFWQEAAQKSNAIAQRYAGTRAGHLTAALLVAIYDEVTRNAERGKQK